MKFHTLQQTLDDQQNLPLLCQDIGEIARREIWLQNEMFGFDAILKHYCHFDVNYQLKAMIDAAPIFEPPWSGQFQSLIPTVMCYPVEMEKFYENSDKKWMGMCSPFLYLLTMIQREQSSNIDEREGTIFFLSHSDRWLYVDSPHDNIIDFLVNLPSQFQPITVALFWTDINDDHHLPYSNAGLRIVSPGHRFDTEFSARLYHLLNQHQFAMGNNFGSYTFFSTVMGIPFSFIPGLNPIVTLRPDALQAAFENMAPLSGVTKYREDMENLFSGLQCEVTGEQMLFSGTALGIEFYKSPEELRKDFQIAEVKWRNQ